MPWIKEVHFYKKFVESIVGVTQTVSHNKVVWFGVHPRMAMIRDYLATFGIDIEYVLDNSVDKQGMQIKREWCLPLGKKYVQIDDKAIDLIVANRYLKDIKVVSPQSFSLRNPDIGKTLFFTAIEDFDSVKKQLLEMGAVEEKIIKVPSEFVLWSETCNYFDSIFVDKQVKDLNAHKVTIVNILREFANFCESKGLKYYLAYGTLIGAVRHGGIIPWDDDIDVMMPVEDYKKFIEIYPRNQQYEVLDYTTNDKYFFPFAKLVDNQTKLHHSGCPITWYQGEYIDIFPVSGYPSTVGMNEWWNKIYLLDVEWYWYYIARDIVPELIDPREKIQNERFKYSCKDSTNVGVMMTLPPKPWRHSVDLVLDSLQLKFEGDVYRVPKDYDSHLRNIYGDYKKLPPEEEREVHGFPTYY